MMVLSGAPTFAAQFRAKLPWLAPLLPSMSLWAKLLTPPHTSKTSASLSPAAAIALASAGFTTFEPEVLVEMYRMMHSTPWFRSSPSLDVVSLLVSMILIIGRLQAGYALPRTFHEMPCLQPM